MSRNLRTPEKRALIREDLKNNLPVKEIVAKHKVSSATVVDVRREMVTVPVAYDLMNDSNGCLKMLNEIALDTKRLYDAVYDAVGDPTGKIDPTPRATEVEVICRRKDKDGNWTASKQSLQSLLEEMENEGYYVRTVKVAAKDNWDKLMDLADRLTKQLEAIAKIQGGIKDVSINIINTEVWTTMQNIILDAVSEHPEVRDVLAKRLAEIGSSS